MAQKFSVSMPDKMAERWIPVKHFINPTKVFQKAMEKAIDDAYDRKKAEDNILQDKILLERLEHIIEETDPDIAMSMIQKTTQDLCQK